MRSSKPRLRGNGTHALFVQGPPECEPDARCDDRLRVDSLHCCMALIDDCAPESVFGWFVLAGLPQPSCPILSLLLRNDHLHPCASMQGCAALLPWVRRRRMCRQLMCLRVPFFLPPSQYDSSKPRLRGNGTHALLVQGPPECKPDARCDDRLRVDSLHCCMALIDDCAPESVFGWFVLAGLPQPSCPILFLLLRNDHLHPCASMQGCAALLPWVRRRRMCRRLMCLRVPFFLPPSQCDSSKPRLRGNGTHALFVQGPPECEPDARCDDSSASIVPIAAWH